MNTNEKKKNLFRYEVTILVDSESPKKARETIESLGVKVFEVKLLNNIRTINQNNALHLWCEQFAEELNEKHIDKRVFFKEPFFVSWTKEGVKNDIWRPMQKAMTYKISTTKLNKTDEISMIWDNINRTVIEKFKGEVIVPQFPSLDNLMDIS